MTLSTTDLDSGQHAQIRSVVFWLLDRGDKGKVKGALLAYLASLEKILAEEDEKFEKDWEARAKAEAEAQAKQAEADKTEEELEREEEERFRERRPQGRSSTTRPTSRSGRRSAPGRSRSRSATSPTRTGPTWTPRGGGSRSPDARAGRREGTGRRSADQGRNSAGGAAVHASDRPVRGWGSRSAPRGRGGGGARPGPDPARGARRAPGSEERQGVPDARGLEHDPARPRRRLRRPEPLEVPARGGVPPAPRPRSRGRALRERAPEPFRGGGGERGRDEPARPDLGLGDPDRVDPADARLTRHGPEPFRERVSGAGEEGGLQGDDEEVTVQVADVGHEVQGGPLPFRRPPSSGGSKSTRAPAAGRAAGSRSTRPSTRTHPAAIHSPTFRREGGRPSTASAVRSRSRRGRPSSAEKDVSGISSIGAILRRARTSLHRVGEGGGHFAPPRTWPEGLAPPGAAGQRERGVVTRAGTGTRTRAKAMGAEPRHREQGQGNGSRAKAMGAEPRHQEQSQGTGSRAKAPGAEPRHWEQGQGTRTRAKAPGPRTKALGPEPRHREQNQGTRTRAKAPGPEPRHQDQNQGTCEESASCLAGGAAARNRAAPPAPPRRRARPRSRRCILPIMTDTPPRPEPPKKSRDVWGLVGWAVLLAVAIGLLLLRSLGGGC